ncbi:MAG TPA: AI-2E family transporter, partial [Tepidisphaeraceae bacterium]
MQRFNARWLGLAAITLIALYLCWLIILPFVDVILWAAVLAVIVYPYHLWLRKRGFGRNTAALISTLGVILVVMLPVAVVMASLATQIPTTDQINDNFIKLQNLITPDNWLYRKINPYFDLERFKDLTWIKERLSDYAGAMAKRSVAVASDIAVVIINICFALFT